MQFSLTTRWRFRGCTLNTYFNTRAGTLTCTDPSPLSKQQQQKKGAQKQNFLGDHPNAFLSDTITRLQSALNKVQFGDYQGELPKLSDIGNIFIILTDFCFLALTYVLSESDSMWLLMCSPHFKTDACSHLKNSRTHLIPNSESLLTTETICSLEQVWTLTGRD